MITKSALVCMSVGDSFETDNPLLKLGGLDLGNVVLTLATRAGHTSSFVATYLGVRVGAVLAHGGINDDQIVWEWDSL